MQTRQKETRLRPRRMCADRPRVAVVTLSISVPSGSMDYDLCRRVAARLNKYLTCVARCTEVTGMYEIVHCDLSLRTNMIRRSPLNGQIQTFSSAVFKRRYYTMGAVRTPPYNHAVNSPFGFLAIHLPICSFPESYL